MKRAPHSSSTAAAAVVAAVAALAAAACGSSAPAPAASAGTGSSRTGTQSLAGSVAGPAALAGSATTPLRLTAVVDTTASVHLGTAQRSPVTITTARGKLTVRHTQGTASQRLLSTKTCKFAFGQHSSYTVLPSKSTGAFAGATGSGTAVITITGTLPRRNGRCDTSGTAQPNPAGLRVSFAAHGPLTVK
jgi:hypothetical protein